MVLHRSWYPDCFKVVFLKVWFLYPHQNPWEFLSNADLQSSPKKYTFCWVRSGPLDTAVCASKSPWFRCPCLTSHSPSKYFYLSQSQLLELPKFKLCSWATRSFNYLGLLCSYFHSNIRNPITGLSSGILATRDKSISLLKVMFVCYSHVSIGKENHSKGRSHCGFFS